jgi:hypothetical protein
MEQQSQNLISPLVVVGIGQGSSLEKQIHPAEIPSQQIKHLVGIKDGASIRAAISMDRIDCVDETEVSDRKMLSHGFDI